MDAGEGTRTEFIPLDRWQYYTVRQTVLSVDTTGVTLKCNTWEHTCTRTNAKVSSLLRRAHRRPQSLACSHSGI